MSSVVPAAKFRRQPAQRWNRNEAVSYVPILLLILLTSVTIFAHDGKILNTGFPVLSWVVALFLYSYRRSTYLAFTIWIWFFTPEVRRLVDFQSSYHSVSPVMIAPLLVTLVALFGMIGHPRFILKRSMLPFLLFTLAVVFSFIVGIPQSGFLPSAFEFGEWLFPLAFGGLIIIDDVGYQENRDALIFSILIGVIGAGLYGLYQFYNLPPWDAYWLQQSKFSSAGNAFEEQVRIFGPLNSPGPFGTALMAGLIYVLAGRGKLRLPAGAAGFPALALCEVRGAWVGLFVGVILALWQMGGKSRLQMIIIGTIASVLTVQTLSSGVTGNLLTTRLSSFLDIEQDASFRARESLYEEFVITAISQPIGVGFGQIGVAAKLATGQVANFDSGVLEIPYEFGWVGGLLIFWALGSISVRIYLIYRRSRDRIVIGASALFFSMLVELIFGQGFSGLNGILIWSASAIVLNGAAVLKPIRIQ